MSENMMSVKEAAELLETTPRLLGMGIKQGSFPFATHVTGEGGGSRYFIFRKKFEEVTGIRTDPGKEVKE